MTQVYLKRAEAQIRQLGQLRPANTTAASLYSPADGVHTEITSIVVCNTTGNTPTFRIFHDEDGTTYDQTSALYYDVTLSAYQAIEITVPIYMVDSSGNLAVRTSAGNEINFTAYGKETHIRAR